MRRRSDRQNKQSREESKGVFPKKFLVIGCVVRGWAICLLVVVRTGIGLSLNPERKKFLVLFLELEL